MKRKHMQSHWKEMLAEQAARKTQNEKPTESKTQEKKKAKKEDKAEVEAKAEVDDTFEDEEDFETEDRKPLWKSACELFHRYRYASLGVTLPLLLLCLLVALSDSDDRPDRVPVSGRVVIDGEPLTSGTIIFIPEDGAHASISTIDETGHFTLTCYDGNDGAVPGTHRMEITLTRALDEGAPPWPVPQKYANQQTSKLTAEITGPTQDLLVQLETDGEQTEGETGPDTLQLPGDGEIE